LIPIDEPKQQKVVSRWTDQVMIKISPTKQKLKFTFGYEPNNFLAEFIPIDIQLQNSENCEIIEGEIRIEYIHDTDSKQGAS